MASEHLASSDLNMDHSFMSRSLWTNNSKFPYHVPDFFTSVQVTQDIPAEVSFGPCVLYNTFYDTIAFIALKSFDRRGKSYVFRVDPDALKSSPLVVPWLRLVQAAMDAEEQNTEAYVKAGQLYFRTIRNISQGEELLVWYDGELSHLLGFSDIKTRALADGFSCGKCGQAFKNRNPFLAHCRFLCTVQVESEQTQDEAKRKVIDFHNIARDMEHKSESSDDLLTNQKRNQNGSLTTHSKSVLLERKNLTNMVSFNTDYPYAHQLEQTIKVTSDSWSTYRLKSDKNNAFTDIKRETAPKPEQIKYATLPIAPLSRDVDVRSDLGLPWGAHAQQKSAFGKPQKRSMTEEHYQAPRLCGPQEFPEDALGNKNPMASHIQSDLTRTQTTALLGTTGSLHYAPDPWCRSITGSLHTSSSSLALLPSTLSSVGVMVQNWCAKCNLSFRMTSDLVFHMRSHHKKEFAAEAQCHRRREEKLTCPICHEYFRERHHLSRHMTSHN